MSDHDQVIRRFEQACSVKDREDALYVIRDVLLDDDPIERALAPAFRWGDPEVVWALTRRVRSFDLDPYANIIGEKAHTQLLPVIYDHLDVCSKVGVLGGACVKGRRAMVVMIVENYITGIPRLMNYLPLAAASGDLELVKYLEEKDGSGEAVPGAIWLDVCVSAAQGGWIEIFRYARSRDEGAYLRRWGGTSLLVAAAKSGDRGILEEVLEALPPKARTDHWELLFAPACRNGTPEFVEWVAKRAGRTLHADDAIVEACSGKAPVETVAYLLGNFAIRHPLIALPSALRAVIGDPRSAKAMLLLEFGVRPTVRCIEKIAIDGRPESLIYLDEKIPLQWARDAANTAARQGHRLIFQRLLYHIPSWGLTSTDLAHLLDTAAQASASSYSKEIVGELLTRLPPEQRESEIDRLIRDNKTFRRARLYLQKVKAGRV